MARHHIDVHVHTAAGPAAIYALLIDGSSWPTWSPIGSFELERPGTSEREGIGAIRIFRTGAVTSHERVAERVPNRRFSYELISGLAIRNYRADVDLSPGPTGTEIHWHSSFDPKVPGTGWFFRLTLGRFIRQVAEGLAAHAAAPAAPAA